MSGFTHLHIHTEYSLLDGASRIKPLVSRAKELGFTSLAITDHGAMYGAVDFYKECKAQGIKPIIGCEVYVAPHGLADKEGKSDREYAHLILLAENEIGYSNLIRLVSIGFVKGFYYKPRIDYSVLARYSEGLICTSACIGGDIPQLLLQNNYDGAKELALRLKSIMGADNFFIEIQDHGLPEQRATNPQLIRIAREIGVGLVVTNDAHYIYKEDAAAHDVLLCIQTGKTIDDPNRMRFANDNFYLKSEAEMRLLFPDIPEAYENTVRIAERCCFDYVFGQLKLPECPLPDGYTAPQYMREIASEGLKKRYPVITDEVRERFEYELAMIERMGYVEYYIIVWDYVHYAKTHGVVVGPGRGSGAASIVAYAMDITTLDPIKYNLLFERFLNPERVSMPDFDVDFDPDGRGRVIDYVTHKYGSENVAQIITFGTMKARMVVRDVGRVLNMSYADCDRIAKMIPFSLDMTLDKALEENPELRSAVAEDPNVAKLMEFSKKLEGLPRHSSTHAAGVVITRKDVASYVPLSVNDDVPVTQFTMKTLEKLGLLKMDFLGLRTLSVVRDTVALTAARGQAPDIYNISFDDPEIYKMLSRGDTDGVFQLESAGMRSFMKELCPSCFEDIIAGIALYRPGPMQSIPRYIEGKKNPGSVTYLHPLLEKSLAVTYGCMVYQEQVMQVVRDLAGYSLGRSDLMRRAMSKKEASTMAKEREIFINGLTEDGVTVVPGAVRNGVDKKTAGEIFDQISSFAAYAFNKAHAACYAVVAYQTAYLKHYYPAEFMAAMLNSFLGDGARAALYIQYCRDNGIKILPPNINSGGSSFTVEDGAVRFGLAAIKNVGVSASDAIIAERAANGPFKGMQDFATRCLAFGAVNKRCFECLIKAGAFDGMDCTRRACLASFEDIADRTSADARRMLEGQMSFFEDESFSLGEDKIPVLEEFPNSELLKMEKEMLGVYLSGHPLTRYTSLIRQSGFNTSMLQTDENGQTVDDIFDGKPVKFIGIITGMKSKVTKNNSIMSFVTMEDLYGTAEVIVFPKVYERYHHLLVEDGIVCVSGRLSLREDEEAKVLAESISEQAPASASVYCRTSSTADFAAGLDKILMVFPGSANVILYFDDIHAKKQVSGITLCDGSVAKLKELFGIDNVKIKV